MKNYFYTRLKRIWELEQLHDKWEFEYEMWADSKDPSAFVLSEFLRYQREESALKIRNEIYTRIKRRTPKHIAIDYLYSTYIGYIDKYGIRYDIIGHTPRNYKRPKELAIVICHTNISIIGTGKIIPIECIFRQSGNDTIIIKEEI